MLYIAILMHRKTKHTCTRFGSYANMADLAKCNDSKFSAEVRPAHQDEIEAKIAELESQRKSVQFNYDNSPWDSGPRYRADLTGLDCELTTLRAHLRAEGSRPAMTA